MKALLLGLVAVFCVANVLAWSNEIDPDLRKKDLNPAIESHIKKLMKESIANGNALIAKFNRGDALSWTSGSLGQLNLTVTGTWWLPPSVCAALQVPCDLEGMILPEARQQIGQDFTEDANYTEIRFDIPGLPGRTAALTAVGRETIVRALVGFGWFADKLILSRHMIGDITVYQLDRNVFRCWAPVHVVGIAATPACKRDPLCYPKNFADNTHKFDIEGYRAHTYVRQISGSDVKFFIKSVDGYGFMVTNSPPPLLGNVSSLPVDITAIVQPYNLDLERIIIEDLSNFTF